MASAPENAYLDDGGAGRIPTDLADALTEFRASELPARAFGERVAGHYARAA